MPDTTTPQTADAATVTEGKPTKRAWVVHPFLFSFFPVLFLYAQNMKQFSPDVLPLPLLAIGAGTGVLWVLVSLVLRNARKAGVLVSLFALLFFSYGHAWEALPMFKFNLAGVSVERTKAVLGTWVLVFAAGTWLTLRTKRPLRQFTRVLNVSAAALIALSLLDILSFEVGARASSEEADRTDTSRKTPAAPAQAGEARDIYWIVMDAYARQDTLKNVFRYDNSDFIRYLEHKGFYVAKESTSNYSCTAMSLSSALNMNYVSDLLPEVDRASTDELPLRGLIRHSEVARFLKLRGYRVVAFQPGYAITDMCTADIYVTPGWFSSEFRNALLNITPVPLIFKRLDYAREHRTRLLFMFDRLERLPNRNSPKLVFAHFLAPHPPFVFGRDGEPVDPVKFHRPIPGGLKGEVIREYQAYYRDELTYLNGRLKQLIDRIIDASSPKPVIILQGDHGTWTRRNQQVTRGSILHERFAILNAYYLPGQDDTGLYPRISPVNSFRVVLNRYFSTHLEMLKDENLCSNVKRPYMTTNVTDLVRAGTRDEPESSGR